VTSTPIPPYALPLPKSAEDIARIHHERKPLALERARRSPLLRDRLKHVDAARLDDPREWRKIPLLTKEELRALPSEVFYRDFCIADGGPPLEFWRSGGSTGKPLFYPRSHEDLEYGTGGGFRRVWPCIGARAGDTVHDAFPLGIHPIGQQMARAAALEGIGTTWAGGGNTTPTALQIELIRDLRPTVLAGMSSYCLHLANCATAAGTDLSASSIRKVLVSAEPLTAAKRAKLERSFGARVYNCFGMTEGGVVACERDGADAGDAMVAFTDLYLLEVIDRDSGEPVPEGEEGALVVTPLWSNTTTPFLRWLSGDIVAMRSQPRTGDPWSVFPLLRHALRTEGFFKIRGVNLNHSDLEDFMFNDPQIRDFKAELVTREALELLRLLIEVPETIDRASFSRELRERVRRTFEITVEIEILATGTLAAEFEKSIKAPRFADRRQ
jgi:phenylacetate-CoA ligase